MKPLAIFVFFTFCHLLDAAAFTSIPDFESTEDGLMKLIGLMRKDDTEKPEFCDVHINYQGYYNGGGQDAAPQPLFSKVNEDLLKTGSYAKLLALRKYFNPITGVAESQSAAKSQAIEDFYDTVWKSKPFGWLIQYLRDKHHPWAVNPATLRAAIKQIWFDNFSRAKGRLDSSAFEHVFFGEEKNNEVSGMHNWAVMYELEKQASEKFNYRGYQKKQYDVIASVNLMWRGYEKPVGSFFANSSPAFDFSVLTACFLTHRGKGEKCPLSSGRMSNQCSIIRYDPARKSLYRYRLSRSWP
ncbi:Endoribonuclease [Aphelenchoides bicaudatus]|nr:Endoribonuclease [Aphelenchoides bicaudatus]